MTEIAVIEVPEGTTSTATSLQDWLKAQNEGFENGGLQVISATTCQVGGGFIKLRLAFVFVLAPAGGERDA